MLLAMAGERDGGIVERPAARTQGEPSGGFARGTVFGGPGAERDPAWVQARRVEILTYRGGSGWAWRPRGGGHDGLHLSHHGPAIGPRHGGEVCLASGGMPAGGAA